MASRLLRNCFVSGAITAFPRSSLVAPPRAASMLGYNLPTVCSFHHQPRPQRVLPSHSSRRLSMDYRVANVSGVKRRPTTAEPEPTTPPPVITSTSSSSSSSSQNEEEAPPPRTFKGLLKQYGPVAIGTYFGIYLATLGSLFAAFEYGFNPLDYASEYGHDGGSVLDKVKTFLSAYEYGRPVVNLIEKNPHAGNFAMAWVTTKFTEPARLLLTIVVVPRLARYLRRPPPPPSSRP